MEGRGRACASMSAASISFICVNVSKFLCKSLSLHEMNSPRENAVGQLPVPQQMLRKRQVRGGQPAPVHMHLGVVLRSGALRLPSAKRCHVHLRRPAEQHACPLPPRERPSSVFTHCIPAMKGGRALSPSVRRNADKDLTVDTTSYFI